MAKKLLFFWIVIPVIMFGAASVYACRGEISDKILQKPDCEIAAADIKIKEAAAKSGCFFYFTFPWLATCLIFAWTAAASPR